MRQPIGSRVDFGVTERRVSHGDGDGIRLALSLRLEPLMQVALLRLCAHAAAAAQQQLAFLPVHQGQLLDACAGSGHDAFEQRAEVRDQTADAGRIEQLGAVLQRAAQSGAFLAERKRQVELGCGAFHRQRLGEQLAQLERPGGRVLQHESHLVQRVAAQIPLRAELGDQPVEGLLLVLVGLQAGLAHASEQRRETRVARQVAAQHERVDEVADQSLEFGAVAPGHRRAHHHIVLSRMAHQQHLEGGQQHHEQGGVFTACQRLEFEQRGRRNLDVLACAMVV